MLKLTENSKKAKVFGKKIVKHFQFFWKKLQKYGFFQNLTQNIKIWYNLPEYELRKGFYKVVKIKGKAHNWLQN